MLKAKDIQPGTYIMRNKKRTIVHRVWMGIIYGLGKEEGGARLNTKHIWFNNGQYDIHGHPHPLDLMERVY